MVTIEPEWTSDFDRLSHLADDQIDLAVASILISQSNYSELEGESELEALDSMASVLADRIQESKDDSPLHTMNSLSGWLYEELQYKGNHENYYDPRNSYINDVIDRRIGIPITLALIYVEVGRRAGIPLVGIGMPGHFLVGHLGITNHFIDPFHNGAIISKDEAIDLFKRITANKIKWSERFLEPVTNREFIIRMLRNLKAAHLKINDLSQTVKVLDMLVAINPSVIEERRDRGLIHYQLGNRAQALADLKFFSESNSSKNQDEKIGKIINELGA
ncbi:MAG: Regulator of sirC expression, contains transglutaminase-like and TPR domains [Chloroflexi bacterium]|nr:MAG: Regulator of sirC expression, contains transglutaminase-like and TPR domains [Chloroflexota bacterium]